MQFDYANIAIFLGLGVILCALLLGLGSLLRPSNPERGKLTTYECGMEVEGSSWINFNIRFYVVALVFVIFDVEVAFVYPVVTVFKQWVDSGRGLFALSEIVLFLGILVCGLLYVWRKGDLDWMKTVGQVAVVRGPAPRGRADVTD